MSYDRSLYVGPIFRAKFADKKQYREARQALTVDVLVEIQAEYPKDPLVRLYCPNNPLKPFPRKFHLEIDVEPIVSQSDIHMEEEKLWMKDTYLHEYEILAKHAEVEVIWAVVVWGN